MDPVKDQSPADGAVPPDVVVLAPATTEGANPPVWLDPARERRVKALTCTEPLHSLQTNRGRRGWDRLGFDNVLLVESDAVVDKLGLDTGISREALYDIVITEDMRFATNLLDDNLQPVVAELIETLIRPNVGEYTSTLDE